MAFLPAKYGSAKNLNKTVDFGWLRSFTSRYDEVRGEKTKIRSDEETKIRSDEETKLQVVEQKIPRRFGRGIFS